MLQNLPVVRRAKFDPTGQYRYCLTRQWSLHQPTLAIIMLNPSQADGSGDDPTIRRCMGLAHQWGFGRITVVNLFAYRTAYPRQLKQVKQPVGPDNDAALQAAAANSDAMLLAWGNWGSLHQRDATVLKLLGSCRPKWHCLGHNQTGQPRHPLYVGQGADLMPWREARP